MKMIRSGVIGRSFFGGDVTADARARRAKEKDATVFQAVLGVSLISKMSFSATVTCAGWVVSRIKSVADTCMMRSPA
jgi:hypothetical protein